MTQNQSSPLFLHVPTSCSVYKLGTNLQFWALYHHSCTLQSLQLLKQQCYWQVTAAILDRRRNTY